MAILLGTSLLAVISLARSGSVLFYRAELVAAPPSEGQSEGQSEDQGQHALGRLGRELAPAVALLLLCGALVAWAGAAHEHTHLMAGQLLTPQTYMEAVLGPPAEGAL